MVIVLVTTMANLTVSSGGQDIQLESMVRNLADVGSYALDEAQMTGVDYGLLIEEEQAAGETSYSYRWLERSSVTAGASRPAARTCLRGSSCRRVSRWSWSWRMRQWSSCHWTKSKDEEEKIAPQVVFYASGEATVGAINVRQHG